MYQKPQEPCREPFTPCWCESRPNNPHCTDALPIDNPILITASIILIIIYTFYIMKPKVKITVSEIDKMNAISKEVNRSWFDKVSTFLWGEKQFRWGELKGL